MTKTLRKISRFMPQIAAVLFLLALSMHNLVSHGMMVDGTFYANIARNLADGVGDLWSPQTAPGDVFADHPPFFFWITSLLYKVFGDHRAVEKWWSFGLMAVQIPLLFFLQSQIADRDRSHFQKPLPWLSPWLFVLASQTFLTATRNLLENLLVPLVLASHSLLFVALGARQRLVVLVSSIAAATLWVMALLTKGVLGLYGGVAIGLLWLISDRHERARCLGITLICLVAVGILGAIIGLDPQARLFFQRYFYHQIVASLQGTREIDHPHFLILWRLLLELIPLVVVSGIVKIWYKGRWAWQKGVLFPLGIALAGSLPLALSPKNREWFLTLTIPYWTLVLALLWRPAAQVERMRPRAWGWASCLFLLISLIEGVRNAGSIRHYPQFHEDFSANPWQEGPATWQDSSVCPADMITRWAVKADFARDYRIRFVKEADRPYLVVDTQAGCSIPAGCIKLYPPAPKHYAVYRCES